ncbi:type I-E CRISPR-associated endoribonuclease Cas2e [Corynebacterium freneyi]|uniref:type I-E CRISPR-associated endoribonuclease Cas2e n=1 Tax=Corynebacterium freneyi TaxID=134034 RepID=UPI000A03AD9E|nr:type I-E CRISPR-associated endoribonuclease Cas2e [Corynebacterium freneyi]
MVTIVLTACPAGLRGHLTRWLDEVAPGVFVGRVSARLRDRLWGLVLELVGPGKALMVYSSRESEKGYSFRSHRHGWELVDYEGLELVQRPAAPAVEKPRTGWSNASHRRRARRRKSG